MVRTQSPASLTENFLCPPNQPSTPSYQPNSRTAVSVGFIPLRWENGDGKSYNGKDAVPCVPNQALPSTLDTRHSTPGRFRRRYLEQELLEVSAVGIPANPSALQLGLKAGAIEKEDLRELLEMLRQWAAFKSPISNFKSNFRSNPEGAAANTRALGRRANEAQLLRLARVLRKLLGRL